jgi:hypothetical protein
MELRPHASHSGESRRKAFSMIFAGRGYLQTSVTVALLIGLALAPTRTSAQEKLTDIKPLVGKWRGHATFQQGTVASDLTILEDGSYTGVVYIKPSVPLAGTIQVVDGGSLQEFRGQDRDVCLVRRCQGEASPERNA